MASMEERKQKILSNSITDLRIALHRGDPIERKAAINRCLQLGVSRKHIVGVIQNIRCLNAYYRRIR